MKPQGMSAQDWLDLSGVFAQGAYRARGYVHNATMEAQAGVLEEQAIHCAAVAWKRDGASGLLMHAHVHQHAPGIWHIHRHEHGPHTTIDDHVHDHESGHEPKVTR